MTFQATRNIPPYILGTIAGTNGANTITGSGTGWVSTDNQGNTAALVFPGDVLIVGTQRANPIKSVDSATAITLELPLAADVPAGTVYRILRYIPSPQGVILAALGALQAQGTDAAADVSRTFDGGSGRIKIRSTGLGGMEIASGPTTSADGALTSAMRFETDGEVVFPVSITAKFVQAGSMLDSPPVLPLTAVYVANVAANGIGSARLMIESYGGTVSGSSTISLRSSRGSESAPSASLQFDTLGEINFHGRLPSSFSSGNRGRVSCIVSENWTDTAQGTYLTFSATLKQSAVPSERLRLDDFGAFISGRVQFNDVNGPFFDGSTVGTVRLFSNLSANAYANFIAGDITCHRTDGSGAVFLGDGSHYLYWDKTNYFLGGSAAGLVVGANVQAAGFVTASDYRIKSNYKPIKTGLSDALAVRVYEGDLHGVVGKRRYVIAHELAETGIPGVVHGKKDATNEDGSPNLQTVDMTQLVATLFAAVQDLAAEVERLKKQ